jgi:hypothetical protein
MVHSGFEASAVVDAVKRPWKIAAVTLKGVKTDGPMAPDIPLHNQRPAEFVFSRHVETKLSEIDRAEAEARTQKTVAAE